MRKFFSIALLLVVGLVLTSACKKEKKEHKHHRHHRKTRVQKMEPVHHERHGVWKKAEDEVEKLIGDIEGEI